MIASASGRGPGRLARTLRNGSYVTVRRGDGGRWAPRRGKQPGRDRRPGNRRAAEPFPPDAAYEAGGDAFDYSLLGDRLHVSIFDALGHGLSSGLLASVAIASCRNTRRARGSLAAMVARADDAIAGFFGDEQFVTALLCDLDLATGLFIWVSCGHPPPLLIRGRSVKELARTARPPGGRRHPVRPAAPGRLHCQARQHAPARTRDDAAAQPRDRRAPQRPPARRRDRRPGRVAAPSAGPCAHPLNRGAGLDIGRRAGKQGDELAELRRGR
jgi:hypothetical protein